jgi:hypothetical protein
LPCRTVGECDADDEAFVGGWIIILNHEQQEIIKEEGREEGQGERQVA